MEALGGRIKVERATQEEENLTSNFRWHVRFQYFVSSRQACRRETGSFFVRTYFRLKFADELAECLLVPEHPRAPQPSLPARPQVRRLGLRLLGYERSDPVFDVWSAHRNSVVFITYRGNADELT